MQTQVTMRKTSELKLHKTSLEIYGENEDVSDLVESIRQNGLLVALTVKPDGTILSGNRRYRAAVKAGLDEVPCVTAEPQTTAEEAVMIVEANRNRKKNVYQQYNEGVILTAAYAAMAKRRQMSGLKQNSVNIDNETSAVVADSATTVKVPAKSCKKGKSSAEVADAIGLKARTWQRMSRLFALSDAGNETATELIREFDNGDISLYKAEQILNQSLKTQVSPNGEPAREKTMFQIAVEQAEKDTRALQHAIDLIIEAPDEQYNSFLCDSFRDQFRFLEQAVKRLDEKDLEHRRKLNARLAGESKNNAA